MSGSGNSLFYKQNRANKSLLRYSSKQLGYFPLSSLWLLADAMLIVPGGYLGSLTGKKEGISESALVSGSINTANLNCLPSKTMM